MFAMNEGPIVQVELERRPFGHECIGLAPKKYKTSIAVFTSQTSSHNKTVSAFAPDSFCGVVGVALLPYQVVSFPSSRELGQKRR